MNWAWAFGILILSIVPGIIGGGLFWHFFEKWTAVVVWEVILLFLLSVVISKGYKKAEEKH
ncbi:MAG: hypothetical protein GX443_10630 [Deltaproteobacteria bacterium]|nr:hypothetical protein [Deltaproteobacteria bacterium]